MAKGNRPPLPPKWFLLLSPIVDCFRPGGSPMGGRLESGGGGGSSMGGSCGDGGSLTGGRLRCGSLIGVFALLLIGMPESATRRD